MEDIKKYAVGRWFIFIAFFTAISGAVYTDILINVFPNLPPINPHSPVMDIISLSVCVLFVTGMYLASKGLGVPLSFKLFVHLLGTSPSRLVLVPYILAIFGSIIYLEFFR